MNLRQMEGDEIEIESEDYFGTSELEDNEGEIDEASNTHQRQLSRVDLESEKPAEEEQKLVTECANENKPLDDDTSKADSKIKKQKNSIRSILCK